METITIDKYLITYLESGIGVCNLRMASSRSAGKAMLMGRKLAFEEILRLIEKDK